MSADFFYNKEDTYLLSGNSRDRRKQLRLLRKKYPNCILRGPSVVKYINGNRVECEEANVVRTRVDIDQEVNDG